MLILCSWLLSAQVIRRTQSKKFVLGRVQKENIMVRDMWDPNTGNWIPEEFWPRALEYATERSDLKPASRVKADLVSGMDWPGWWQPRVLQKQRMFPGSFDTMCFPVPLAVSVKKLSVWDWRVKGHRQGTRTLLSGTPARSDFWVTPRPSVGDVQVFLPWVHLPAKCHP